MKCRWATLHWIRFAEVETPQSLDLSGVPRGAASWKIGPDGPVGPDGTRVVMTTAGYDMGPELDVDRVIDFRRNVDAVRDRMIAAAYRPGAHRERVDRHMREAMADRTSFSRLRVLRSGGTWHGRDPACR